MKQRLAKSTDLIRNAYKTYFGHGRIFRDDYNTDFKKTLNRCLKLNQFSPYQSSLITRVSMLLHIDSGLQFPYFQINHPYVSPDTGNQERKLNFFLPISRAFEPHPADNISTLNTDSGQFYGPWSFTNIDLLSFLKSV